MAEFHQDHQQIYGQQQNADTITNTNQSLAFGTVQRPADLPAVLTQVQSTITQATNDGILPKKTSIPTRAALEQAIVEAEEPKPDKKSILGYLTTAKSLIEGIAAASALVPSIISAIEAVQKVL